MGLLHTVPVTGKRAPLGLLQTCNSLAGSPGTPGTVTYLLQVKGICPRTLPYLLQGRGFFWDRCVPVTGESAVTGLLRLGLWRVVLGLWCTCNTCFRPSCRAWIPCGGRRAGSPTCCSTCGSSTRAGWPSWAGSWAGSPPSPKPSPRRRRARSTPPRACRNPTHRPQVQ